MEMRSFLTFAAGLTAAAVVAGSSIAVPQAASADARMARSAPSLVIRAKGLPRRAAARVVVKPKKSKKVVVRVAGKRPVKTKSLRGLAPGQYTVRAKVVRFAGTRYKASDPVKTVRVRASRSVRVVFRYRKAVAKTVPQVPPPQDPPPRDPPAQSLWSWTPDSASFSGLQGSVWPATLRLAGPGPDVQSPALRWQGAAAGMAGVQFVSIEPGPSGDPVLRVAFEAGELASGSAPGELTLLDGDTVVSQVLPVTLSVAEPGSAIPDVPADPSPSRIVADPGGQKMVRDEVLVSIPFASRDPQGAIRSLAQEAGALIIGSVPEARVYQLRFVGADLPAVQAKKDALAAAAGVEAVSLNLVADDGALFPNDPLSGWWDWPPSGSNWHQEFVDAPGVWDVQTGSASTKIAIIDGGFDPRHGDLKNNVVEDFGYDGLKWKGHGTHVAGIACAEGNNGIGFAGMMWDCSMSF